MKKTKLLALASLLLVAGLVGCGSKTSSSEAPATSNEPTSVAPAPTSEGPATTSNAPAPTSDAPVTTSNTPAPTSEGPAGNYETTPALTGIPMDVAANYTLDAAISGDIVFGNFTLVQDAGKTGSQVNANKKSWNGVEYTHRINVKSGNHTLQFTAEKAGKLVLVTQSSSKADARTATLDGAGSYTVPVSTSKIESVVEIPFSAAGTHTFQATGGAWYLWAAWVYYVA